MQKIQPIFKLTGSMASVARRARNDAAAPTPNADAVHEVMAAFTEFKKSYGRDADSMQGQLDEMQAILQTPDLGGGGIRSRGSDQRALSTERNAMALFARSGDENRFRDALSISSDPSGGYTVMPSISKRILERVYDQSVVGRLARKEILTTGDAFEEPVDAVDSVDAEWVGEQEARPSTLDSDPFKKLSVSLDELYALCPITQRLLDDSGYDLGSWLERKISDKIARKAGQAFVTGNGVRQPKGFLENETDTAEDDIRDWWTLQHVISGLATSITADSLVDLEGKLRAPFRKGSVWLMNRFTASRVRKLKDGEGRYIWADSLAVGNPPVLLGHPVELDEEMPNIGAGALPIAFGNFERGYLVTQRPGLKFLRDPYSSKPNVLFYCYARFGGAVSDSDAIKLLKIAAE